MRRRAEWPSAGELVLCTVTKIFPQGVFVSLDEYGGKEGMVHISEVASGWIKNIRDHVKDGQKVVCKVLFSDPQRRSVDLSIRRVKDSERRWKAERLKLEQRAEKLLELVAKKLGKTLDQAYEEAGFPLQEKFGDLYAALEAAIQKPGSLEEVVGKRWAKMIEEQAAATVEKPRFTVSGTLSLVSFASNGIEAIKTSLIKAEKAVSDENVKVEIVYLGAPRYMIKITAPSYKVGEAQLKKFAEIAIGEISKSGGRGELVRKET
ncbi:MAG: translation initiation factor IF-2 subunit alpha [Candidatus Hadarchaeales archaeon]